LRFRNVTPLTPSRRFLPLLLILFIGSGCSALIYEVVWLQLLQLVIGSSAASLAVLLSTFMGGMCLGSLLLPRYISRCQHPLKVYAALELGTALFGFIVLLIMPYVQTIYTAGMGHWMNGHALAALVFRCLACAVCLLPPTMMMGATLPAISRWIAESPDAASWWGFFYGGNIAGGVIGCLGAGFYLLRVFDMATASYVAAGVNVVVGGLSLLLARSLSYSGSSGAESPESTDGSLPVLIAIATSGLCALGAEVVWTRLLSLMLGATVYTFSIILAVFLTGLGIGSAAGAYFGRLPKPRLSLALCQLLQAFTVVWAALMLAYILPYWAGNVDQKVTLIGAFAGDITRCAIAVLPSAILWGASFPLALAAVPMPGRDPGKLVGEVYAANTVGAIVGALAFSLVLIPQAGTQHSQQVLIILTVLSALVVWHKPGKLIVAIAAAMTLTAIVPAIPWKLIGFGRRLPTTLGNWTLLYASEGMNSSIAYSKYEGVTTYFHVSGKVEASAEPQDMRLQRLLGHLPALLHPGPKSVLIVGCGAGVTAGTFVVHPEVEHITICEIEPRIPPASAKYFPNENHNVVTDRRTHIVYDDARHFVLTTTEKFDIITSDPIHPWVKGIAPLYSTEYFQLCKQHLNPGGFVTQWVPLYESSVETVQSELATFFEVFPHGTVFGNLNTDGSGYDVVLVGQADPLHVNVDEIQRRLHADSYAAVRRSLQDVGYNSGVELLATYAVRGSDLRDWLRNAQINRDRNLRLQYLAGLGLNEYMAPQIYQSLLSRSTFPTDIFTGDPPAIDALRSAMGRQRMVY
jgi:spermidine synthase